MTVCHIFYHTSRQFPCDISCFVTPPLSQDMKEITVTTGTENDMVVGCTEGDGSCDGQFNLSSDELEKIIVGGGGSVAFKNINGDVVVIR